MLFIYLLCQLQGTYCTKDEAVDVICKIASKTFDGNFCRFDNIVSMFVRNKFNFYFVNEQGLSQVEGTLYDTVNFRDGYLHSICDDGKLNYDSTRLVLKFCNEESKNKLKTLIEGNNYPDGIKVSQDGKDLILKWIDGSDDWKHNYVDVLDMYERDY